MRDACSNDDRNFGLTSGNCILIYSLEDSSDRFKVVKMGQLD